MTSELSKENIISNLDIIINGLSIIKDKIINNEPVSNSQWLMCAEPLYESMNFLLNYKKK